MKEEQNDKLLEWAGFKKETKVSYAASEDELGKLDSNADITDAISTVNKVMLEQPFTIIPLTPVSPLITRCLKELLLRRHIEEENEKEQTPQFVKYFDACVDWLLPLLKPICEWELSPCEEGYLFSLFAAVDPDKPIIDINVRGKTPAIAASEAIEMLVDKINGFEKEMEELDEACGILN